ncbi:zinc finger, c2h2-type integrase, dna-binding [Trichoderma arundinaceum]|uniref:Zinc finger, c2h2-type integrase, dna-binding n=1 Tax=Trichoderma arundinaceum TaxID=490622 RepID=A0A395NL94_TRIAR|nr:zinc finger, c2h2-type integrase, dna-binding [Trichoderma arundinaceum]
MALATQQQDHASWGRWSQQMPHNFPIMGSQGLMPYDPRAQAGSQMQRQVSVQYLMDSNYSQSPVSTVSSSQYQNLGTFSYVPYQSPPPSTPLGSPFKAEFHEHPFTRMPNSAASQRSPQSTKEYQPYSPVSRKGSISSVANKPSTTQRVTISGPATPDPSTPGSAASSPITPGPMAVGHVVNSKTLNYNETIDPADRISFKTDIDQLMKAIQRAQTKEEHQQTLTPVQTPKAVASADTSRLRTQSGKPRKQYVCDGPNCGKSFYQKTHRDIHSRTHTGERPYVCDIDNCGLTFSQRGNLKTHLRRHTGEKPFPCSVCGKAFAQRGNLRSHEETHRGLKPFVCRLDNCNKAFSQLGNMKTHQNNFHKPTLQNLTAMFVQFSQHGEVPEAYHDLFDYFQKHYKNSNKGVKGRGRTRAVAARGSEGAAFRHNISPVSAPVKTPMATHLPHMSMPVHTQVMTAGRPSPYANTLSHVLRNPNPSYGLLGPESPHAIYEMALSGSQATYAKNC